MTYLKVLIITTSLLITTSIAQDACCAEMGKANAIEKIEKTFVTTQVQLPSMQCNMCEETILGGLKNAIGISSVSIDLELKVSNITYDPQQIGISDIEKVVSNLGYWANNIPADPSAYSNLHTCCKMTEAEHQELLEESASHNLNHAQGLIMSKKN